jgi:NitT/TauT family transport system substrate-binding protein
MRKHTVFGLFTAAALTFAVSCGSDDDDSGSESAAGTTAAAAGTTAAGAETTTAAVETTAPAETTAAGADTTAAAAAGEIPTPEGDLSFKVGFPAAPGFSDLPILMTIDKLNAEGWDISTEVFSDQALQTEALLSDAVQFTSGNPLATLTAIQEGAPLALVGERSANDWIVVAQEDIQSCEDLAGKQVPYQSEASVSTYMLKTYVQETCGVEPSYFVLEGSANRAAAMVGGQIDATIVQVEDWLVATQNQDTSAHILADIKSTLPELTTATYAVARPWLEENSELLSAFLAHLLVTNREANADLETLRQPALEHLEGYDEAALDAVIDAYSGLGIFFEDGGLTEDKVAYSVDFFANTGGLEPGMTVEQAADLGPLTTANQYVGS